MMQKSFNRVVVSILVPALVVLTMPAAAVTPTMLTRGSATATEAARSSLTSLGPVSTTRSALQGSLDDETYLPLTFAALEAGTARADSTIFEFPEDENKHLVRDITVFIIASAFIAYFIVKVFIVDDTDDGGGDGGGGKTIPGA